METFDVLMSGSTEHTFDILFKSGAVLAEVGSSLQISFDDLHFQTNSIVKVAFSVAKGAFEVWLSIWCHLVIDRLCHYWKQVLKEQKKRDEAVSDLVDSISRILPFADLVLEDIICEETELLERVVKSLCALIRDTANFICEYAKQSLASTSSPTGLSAF
jgi:hypothetical protein